MKEETKKIPRHSVSEEDMKKSLSMKDIQEKYNSILNQKKSVLKGLRGSELSRKKD